MKILAFLFLTLGTFCASLPAVDNLYEMNFTITYKDGSESDGSTIFQSDDPVMVPIDLNIGGLCVLRVDPGQAEKTVPFSSALFQILMTSGSSSAEMKTLFKSYLPISMGKEFRLFKALEQSLVVKISEIKSEE